MSTPTDKSMRPMDSFVRVPHETQGPGGRERHPIDSDSEPIRPPYAPAKAREGADAEGDPGENDPLRSPYAPKKLRTQSAQAPRVAEDVTPLAPPRGPESLRETSDRHALGSELDISLQPMHRHGQQTEGPTPGRRAESLRDLKRLETTLRRIQREEAAARIPRAAQLPPVPGLVTPDASGRLRSREMLDFPSPRSLKPERMPPPPTRSRRHTLRALLVILVASVFAIPLGYYFSTGGWSPSSRPSPGPQTASLGLQPNAPPSSIVQQEVPPTITRDDDRGMLAPSETSSQPPRRSSEGETVVMLQPSAADDPAIRVLDPEAIKLLMRQGEQLIAAGDVVTARTVFQRAAEAGNAGAAMALGATYDPQRACAARRGGRERRRGKSTKLVSKG